MTQPKTAVCAFSSVPAGYCHVAYTQKRAEGRDVAFWSKTTTTATTSDGTISTRHQAKTIIIMLWDILVMAKHCKNSILSFHIHILFLIFVGCVFMCILICIYNIYNIWSAIAKRASLNDHYYECWWQNIFFHSDFLFCLLNHVSILVHLLFNVHSQSINTQCFAIGTRALPSRLKKAVKATYKNDRNDGNAPIDISCLDGHYGSQI